MAAIPPQAECSKGIGSVGREFGTDRSGEGKWQVSACRAVCPDVHGASEILDGKPSRGDAAIRRPARHRDRAHLCRCGKERAEPRWTRWAEAIDRRRPE